MGRDIRNISVFPHVLSRFVSKECLGKFSSGKAKYATGVRGREFGCRLGEIGHRNKEENGRRNKERKNERRNK